MSPVEAIFVPFLPKTGTNLLHPPPPQSLNGSKGGEDKVELKHESTLKRSSLAGTGLEEPGELHLEMQ